MTTTRRLPIVQGLLDELADGPGAAVVLDLCDREGWLLPEDARPLVPRAWDLCGWPMSVLPRDRWVALFRLAGYTHEFESAVVPAEPLRLYRGSDEAGEQGMCWSSNPDVARWLASHHEGGRVWVAEVESWRLLAFMAATYEDQYVVDTTDLAARLFEGSEVVARLDVDDLAARLDALVEALPAAAGPEAFL